MQVLAAKVIPGRITDATAIILARKLAVAGALVRIASVARRRMGRDSSDYAARVSRSVKAKVENAPDLLSSSSETKSESSAMDSNYLMCHGPFVPVFHGRKGNGAVVVVDLDLVTQVDIQIHELSRNFIADHVCEDLEIFLGDSFHSTRLGFCAAHATSLLVSLSLCQQAGAFEKADVVPDSASHGVRMNKCS